ncbi:PREDICTED: HERV-H LTR-associating protein 2 [Nanorana parkeri]|uniref:HERV-H LTR-associating protein 2 n=1 Tax=Nanorana parkeri TaxID=125878 RepID=UPI000854518C|nr:PREDICTED: HERV-H LTR-associating protein 2 [Nanorana parkeri]
MHAVRCARQHTRREMRKQTCTHLRRSARQCTGAMQNSELKGQAWLPDKRIHSTPQVIGELNGVIILPCSLTPGEIEVIHWTFEGKNVHSYYEGKDVFDDQDPSYVGRTSLFLDQIKNGNASLQLKNLQKSDEQTYSCYLSTTKESKEFPVQLKVEVAVWGEQHKNFTIPCSFNPGEEVVIHWRIVNDDSRSQNMLEKQDKSYKGRTSLILSELAKGNASLQLRDLQEGDENTYSCYVGTRTGNKEDKVKLHVADFGHSMEYTLDHDELKCYASHVYPSDIVTIEWYEDNHIKQQGISTSSLSTLP